MFNIFVAHTPFISFFLANLNYDLISSYVLSLSVTDGLHAIGIDIDIVITDVNNGPPTFPQAQYKAAVSETASTGTSVITIVADDPDAETSPFGKLVYTLIVNPSLKFNIDPDVGTITVAGALDAEKISMYNLVIQAKEEGGSNSATAQCNVTIEDENDNAPTCSKYSFSVSLPESTTASMIIYTLDCKDKDITSVLQYSLASGDTTLFQMNQSSLRLLTNIDYDIIVTDTFEVKISVSDGKNTVQVTGVVTVIGVNEYAPVFNPGKLSAFASVGKINNYFFLHCLVFLLVSGHRSTQTDQSLSYVSFIKSTSD